MEKGEFCGIPPELLMELAKQFDERGGILTIDGISSSETIGILHLLRTTDEDGRTVVQLPPFRHEFIPKKNPSQD